MKPIRKFTNFTNFMNKKFICKRKEEATKKTSPSYEKEFVKKNEASLKFKKMCAEKLGFSKKDTNLLDKLFRLRKAGELASKGHVSKLAAKQMISFLKERKKDLLANGDESTALDFETHINSLKRNIKIDSANFNREVNKKLDSEGAKSHYVFDPKGKQKLKILNISPDVGKIIQKETQELIESTMGNKYNFLLAWEKNKEDFKK